MNNKLLLIGMLLLFTQCKKEDKYPAVMVFGHAGDGMDIPTAPYPENTADAIRYTLSYPEISGVEIDIQWSKDGTAWVFHDTELGDQTSISGCVRSRTDAELETVHYKGLQQEKLPKLNEIAPLVSNRKVMLDLKDYKGCGDSLTNAEVHASLTEFKALLNNTEVYVIVQELNDVAFFNSLGWKILLEVYTMNSYYATPNWSSSSGCVVRNSDITRDEIRNVQSNGKEVVVFDVKSPKAIKQSLKKGVNIILADDIKATLIQKIR